MVPFSGVNLMALESRFSSTWFRRTLSQQTFSVLISWIDTLKVCFLARIWGCTMLTILSITSRREIWSIFIFSLPLSILLMSSTSLIRPSRCLLERAILLRQFCSCCLLSMLAVAMAVMPTMAFIGVRISWLMLERKSLLALLAFSASRCARISSCIWVLLISL